ncbi:TPA: AbiV family abortive infection protein [Legionella pneumophila]|uniref:AbiV family abortive infection protein n=1 Tax=Legionella pneumophila TaxID=446 RepID=UPI001375379C|nr:AbiV family abortive infection protein [Legionella pneumophila]HAT8123688.1 AbiV family abortive infection protein [Legionella pneumophila]HAT8308664.1 AbiV family abortive infection protein [Legionella pneumophila]HAT8752844.1 AbiV family abortive infection protein [Legionella pneumophila]HAU1977444.1 AbiV family abortive infection protein [Legionella pneumophila]HAV0421919.1 AbiV family abortive infection protein [Legionella pneumophila]
MKISKVIFKNAQSLLRTSLTLFSLGEKYHSAHFAALCLEECSKSLMYLQEVEELFKDKKRNHFKKEELVGFFHYLAGKLSAAYSVKHLFDKSKLGNNLEVGDLLISKILQSSGMKGKEGLIEGVKLYMQLENPTSNITSYPHNEIRKNSVYVDVVDGAILTPPKRINNKEIKDIIELAKFGVSLMNMALYNRFSWYEFLENYPKLYPHPKQEAKKLLKSFQKQNKKSNQ